MRPRIGGLCSGTGVLEEEAAALAGGTISWYADPDPAAAAVLAHHHPDVPNLGDIRTVDWTAVEPVDVLTAGFPCQDISNAGKRSGIKEGTRSGLWAVVADAVRVLRPQLVLLENVAAITTRGLDRVLADLAALGYVGRYVCLRASDIGAPHRRDRWFLAAWPAYSHRQGPQGTQPEARRVVPDGRAAADSGHGGVGERSRPQGRAVGERPSVRGVAGGGGAGPAADTSSAGRQGRVGVDPSTGAAERRGSTTDWGRYSVAVARWERVLRRPAPRPVQPGRSGRDVLAPAFVEWLMGLGHGHVTGVPGLSRSQQLRLLGNGVVPRQAAHAYRSLDIPLADLGLVPMGAAA